MDSGNWRDTAVQFKKPLIVLENAHQKAMFSAAVGGTAVVILGLLRPPMVVDENTGTLRIASLFGWFVCVGVIAYVCVQ
jgi:hypothetical protein